jgi:1-acyl-sn-glycerol-3-phosphate acyltransferase
MNVFYRLTVFSLKVYFLLFYRLKIYGLENLPEGPAILAPNHVSFLDPPLIAASCKEEVSFLARSSLFEHFLMGPIISRLNSYPVSGTAQDLSSFKLIGELLRKNKKVVVFPEGIRSDDGELGAIKSGIGMLSQRSLAPIVPVYINGTFEVWNKAQKFPKPWGKISCVFGKPIYPQNFENFGKKQAQEKMAAATEESILSLKSWLSNI